MLILLFCFSNLLVFCIMTFMNNFLSFCLYLQASILLTWLFLTLSQPVGKIRRWIMAQKSVSNASVTAVPPPPPPRLTPGHKIFFIKMGKFPWDRLGTHKLPWGGDEERAQMPRSWDRHLLPLLQFLISQWIKRSTVQHFNCQHNGVQDFTDNRMC